MIVSSNLAGLFQAILLNPENGAEGMLNTSDSQMLRNPEINFNPLFHHLLVEVPKMPMGEK